MSYYAPSSPGTNSKFPIPRLGLSRREHSARALTENGMQLSMFDSGESRRRAEEGGERAYGATDDTWKLKARTILHEVCRNADGALLGYRPDILADEFLAERLWQLGLEEPREKRAMQGVMDEGVGHGWCEKVAGKFRPCQAVSGHAGPRAVWRSKIRSGRS